MTVGGGRWRQAADLDALVIPGGWAPDYWRRDERFKRAGAGAAGGAAQPHLTTGAELVRDMDAAGKPIATIVRGRGAGPGLVCSVCSHFPLFFCFF